MRILRFVTKNGVRVTRNVARVPYKQGLKHLARELDSYRGFYLSSGYEYPGRYSRWDIACVRPSLEIVAFGRRVEFRPLNPRGEILVQILHPILAPHDYWESLEVRDGVLCGQLKPLPKLFPEEERSKQPSVFSVLRTLMEEFHAGKDSRLALVGAFGYDLLFQFDPIELKLPRTGVKDLHLFLCDDIYFMDRMKEQIERYEFDFEAEGLSTARLPRSGEKVPPPASVDRDEILSDHQPQEYMAKVEQVREGMRRGDYYEVVLRQTFRTPYSDPSFGVVRAHAAPQPEPVRVPPAVRRRAARGRLAGDVRARGRHPGRDLPDLGNGPQNGRSAARCR